MRRLFIHTQTQKSIVLLTIGLAIVAYFWIVPHGLAQGRDIDVTLVAAAPASYDHASGGGAYNDGTKADDADIQADLRGAGLACGDIVSYLALLEVDERASATDQVAELQFSFAAQPSGQPGVGHAAVLDVTINYGQVENGDNGSGVNPGAGAFGLDSALNDDRQSIASGDQGSGGSSVSYQSHFAPTGTTIFDGAEELLLDVRVDDLDPGETIVLRMDIYIACQANSSPRGSMQTAFVGGAVVAENGQTIASDAIRSGGRPISVSDIETATGVNEPLMQITHTVTPPNGVCGVDDTDAITIEPGLAATYCVTVSNLGTDPLFDVEVIDTTGRAIGDPISLSNLVNLDGESDNGDLLPGASATGQYQISYDTEGSDQRTVTGQGNNGGSGSGLMALSGADGATVTITAPSPTAIELATINTSSGPDVRTTAITMAISGLLGLVLTGYAYCYQGGLNWARVRD